MGTVTEATSLGAPAPACRGLTQSVSANLAALRRDLPKVMKGSADLAAAGYRVVAEPAFLPNQYFLIFLPAGK